MQAMGSANQGMGSATHNSRQFTPPQPVPEEEPSMGDNRGVTDIPNYPRENPLFDEDQPQQAVQEEAAVAQPVFHDNPAYDGKSSGQASLGSPMIPNRSSTQAPGAYESSPQRSERQAQPHSGFEDPVEHSGPHTSLDVIDIPPVFDPSNTAAAPQFVNTAADQEAGFGSAPGQTQLDFESLDSPREEGATTAPVTAEPQVYDNSTFEQEGQRGEQPYSDSSVLSGQGEHSSAAVTAANAAVEEEVMNMRQPQAETETVSNAAEDGRAPEQQPLEQQPPQVSETVIDEPLAGETSTPPLGESQC